MIQETKNIGLQLYSWILNDPQVLSKTGNSEDQNKLIAEWFAHIGFHPTHLITVIFRKKIADETGREISEYTIAERIQTLMKWVGASVYTKRTYNNLKWSYAVEDKSNLHAHIYVEFPTKRKQGLEKNRNLQDLLVEKITKLNGSSYFLNNSVARKNEMFRVIGGKNSEYVYGWEDEDMDIYDQLTTFSYGCKCIKYPTTGYANENGRYKDYATGKWNTDFIGV